MGRLDCFASRNTVDESMPPDKALGKRQQSFGALQSLIKGLLMYQSILRLNLERVLRPCGLLPQRQKIFNDWLFRGFLSTLKIWPGCSLHVHGLSEVPVCNCAAKS